MEPKKISFGFMKTKKAEKPIVEEKRDYIECLEEHSIKIVGGDEVKDDKPLIIPMKPNTLVTAERLKEIAAKVESSLEETEVQKDDTENNVDLPPTENETLDQMAVRELLQEAKKDIKVEDSVLTVPVPSKPVIDGQKESTLDDYESVPIQDFGLAMLRGMGWTPNKDQSKYKQPQLRPKGLGLGADKVISENQKKKSNKDNQEELTMKKNSYVKITTGKYSGYYGKVISMDEDNGRVMVDLTMAKETVNLNEFMMQPVTKAEFDKESKVINSDAYKDYKKNEGSRGQKLSRNDSPQIKEKSRDESSRNSETPSSSQKNDADRRVREDRREEERSNGRSKDATRHERSRKDSSSSDDRSRRRKDKARRHSSSSEDRSTNRKENPKMVSLSSGDRGRDKKEKQKRDSSSSEDRRRKKKDRHKRSSSSSDEKKKKKDKYKKRYSSNDSLSSISDSDRKQKKDKRDIDKKRKGKKKKRDRDRSPNYKKHRK